MAKYENPQPQEGINYSDEHPLKEFVQLVIGVAIAAAVLFAIVNVMAGTIARNIPFAFEKNMVDQFEVSQLEASPQQAYLQQLTDRVAAQMDLPEEMHITAHYSDSDMVNALATLGGNLIIFQGLIDMVQSEQELAAVIGHEVAHIKLRHPIVALGKGVTFATLVAFVGGASGSGAG
ncbi:MAG: M48 family metalloprotease, partial [Arenicella sp.]|nr:M48 family metalloprotease [Arenicella sp.]